jgi:signal transduction histidine kinase
VLNEAKVRHDAMRSVAERSMSRRDDWLVGGGEMGKVIRAADWSDSPLGPLDSWPQSLRTTVGLCLASNFPISLVWGPGYVQIYNDGYWPICGKKHPDSMGQSFRECWASPWPVIGESFERALGGETSYLENQRMFLDRYGYPEETFFTFSFSPIRDESGGVGGLFHPVTETTAKMISERRTRTLRDLASRTGKAQSTKEALILAAQAMADAALDLPFALFYTLDPVAGEARLAAATGLEVGGIASPAVVDLKNSQPAVWPITEVFRSSQVIEVDDVARRLGSQVCGPYPEPPHTALLLPILPPGSERPIAILIVGVSARLPFNEIYRAFCDFVAAAVTAAVANARAYEEERRRAEALAEIDRAKTAFFSNVSHEFRTPLTLMLGPLEDELSERIAPLPPPRRERLETAHRNTLRLLKLVNTLLDFSRIEAGRMQATYEPVDLGALTGELASVFRAAIEKAGMTLAVDCPLLGEPVFVDREMWEKIVLNLISNALKHTFAGGIKVSLTWGQQVVVLAISDTGVGIPDNELPHLFERFHRVKGAASRSHEGTGIGLALVKELVTAHGGTVRVDSVVDRGSTFTVTVKTGTAHLPADRIVAPRALGVATTRASAFLNEVLHWLPAGAAAGRDVVPSSKIQTPSSSVAMPAVARARILWADDNADMLDYVRRLLSDQYDVQAVADGKSALAAAVAEPPDLILSDVMMPGLDGFSLLRALRSDPRTLTVPVILLSARAGEESAVEGLQAGADDYLVKPFSARELLARVRTHVDLSRLRREWSQQLEEANRELESFSYSVSHDLRAPLRGIDGFSKAILARNGDQLDAQGKVYLQRVRAATARMSNLIDDLLNLARISRSPLRRESVNLSEVAADIAAELRRQHPARKVEIEIEERLIVNADPRLAAVILENLIGNAWKFTGKRASAQITVGQTVAPASPSFFVRDNGAGFDRAYAGAMFQPFQRMHADSEFEGSGIGLATVRRVVVRHGGRIWADSEVDQGATFFFTLGGPH